MAATSHGLPVSHVPREESSFPVARAQGSGARQSTAPTPVNDAAAEHIEQGSWVLQSVVVPRSHAVRARPSAFISAWASGVPRNGPSPGPVSQAWFRPSASSSG